jgi:hypothetical protein
VGLERGPPSLVSTIEELLARNSSSSGLENKKYGCRDQLCLPHDTLYLRKLALTLPTSDGRSFGIICSRTKVTERKICLGSQLNEVFTSVIVCWFGFVCAILKFILIVGIVVGSPFSKTLCMKYVTCDLTSNNLCLLSVTFSWFIQV